MARRTKTETAPASYLFKIGGIHPDYSFGTAHPPYEHGTLSEYAHTEIQAECLVPKRLSGRSTRITLLGDRGLTRSLAATPKPAEPISGIGTLTMRGSQSEYLGSLPFDALLALAPLILARGLRYIYMSGPPLWHGSSRITYMAFKQIADPADY